MSPESTLDPTPFAQLTPDRVLDALAQAGLEGDGRVMQLNSFENRVYQAFLEDRRAVVVKFYRPGRWSDEQILEEHALALDAAQAEVPVAAPLAFEGLDGPITLGRQTLPEGGELRFSITPRQGGRSPDLESLEHLAWMGRVLGRFHAVAATQPFLHRPRLDVFTLGERSRSWLAHHEAVAQDARPAWLEASARALELAAQAFHEVGECPELRLHGDVHAGNVLWADDGPHLVDLDDCARGPAVQDLWMLLPGALGRGERANEAAGAATTQAALRAMLSGYEQFMAFDDAQLRLIEPLRTLRILHHSAWLAQRMLDPAFPRAFPWFGQPGYWAEQAALLLEQCEAMERG